MHGLYVASDEEDAKILISCERQGRDWLDVRESYPKS